jgi:hypothetical protein
MAGLLIRAGHGRRALHGRLTLLHRTHDVVIAGTAAQVAFELVADRLRIGIGAVLSRAVAAITMPGVQKPHCRPWHSRNACCTGAFRR